MVMAVRQPSPRRWSLYSRGSISTSASTKTRSTARLTTAADSPRRYAMFKRFRARRTYQYSRWDGTQRLEDFNAETILDALSDDYLRHGDLKRALERLRQSGYTTHDGQRRMGMQDLMNRLRERRKQQMQRYDMSGVMDQIQEQLDRVKQLEREGIQRRLDEHGQSSPQDKTEDSSNKAQQSGESGQE